MSLIKHSQRHKATCKQCGEQVLGWYHDTERSGFKVCHEPTCSMNGQRCSWVLGKDGVRHVCRDKVETPERPKAQCEKCGQWCEEWTIASHRLNCLGDYSWSTPKPAEETPKPVEAPKTGSVDESAVRDLLELLGRIGGTVNPEQVRAIVTDEISKVTFPTIVKVEQANGDVKQLDQVHKVFPEVLRALQVDNVWLVGPAGTGKSTIGKQCAEALSVPFGFMALTITTPVSEVMGYMDANGNYVASTLRRLYELCEECGPDNCSHGHNGGVFLFDEMDNGSPNSIGKVNEAMANGHAAFPDRLVKRHPRFYAIAAGNTYGTGPDRQYVGRTQLDAATLDRFAQIFVPIDEALEESAAYAECEDRDKVFALLAKVRTLRARAESLKMNVIFSPRASIKGAALLQAGFSHEQVVTMRVRKGISDQDWAKLNS